MQLISCHIEHFGKLSDFTYHFEEGLNVLLEENGWGKSTLAAFLRVMFYGFDGEGRRSDTANERTRFRPWGGGTYGGSVTFACTEADRRYRVLRTFGARHKEDSFLLLDEKTGLASDAFTENLGEELFGIDAESFRRSIFFTLRDGRAETATASMQAKIGNLSGEEADMRQYDAARSALKKEMDRLTPDRAAGQISRARQQLTALQAESAREPFLLIALREQNAQIDSLRKELAQVRREQRTLAEKSAQLQAEDARPPAADLAASRARLTLLRREEGEILSQGQQERAEYLQILRERREEERQSAKAAQEHRSVRRARQIQKQNRELRLFLPAGTASAAAGVLLVLLALIAVLPVWTLIPGVALLCLGAGFLLCRRALQAQLPSSSGGNERTLRRLRAEEARSRARLQELSAKLHRTQRQIHAQTRRYNELLQKKAVSEAAASTESEPDTEMISSDRTGGAGEHSSRFAAEFAALSGKEEELRSELLALSRRSEETGDQLRRCKESAQQCLSLQEKIASMEHRYEVCRQTARYLEQAKNAFTTRYREPFLRAFRRYYSVLTGESGDPLQADASLSVTVSEAGLPRDPALLSDGTRDLLALCRRMAMADAMYPQEKPFLVLDDPFVNLDDRHLEGGLRFLRDVSCDYQILYLTCHTERVPEY